MTAATKLNPEKIELTVTLSGRDEIRLQLDVVRGEIQAARLQGRGCSEFLKTLAAYRPQLTGPVSALPIPAGTSHADLLLREAILRAKGEWELPYTEDELCHCRAVSTAKVDAAIVGGCHSARAVARETSAGTSCGSCRPETEALLAYRLRQP